MSGLSRVLFGEASKPASVVNTTPQPFQNLATPLSQVLTQQLQSPNRYSGPYAAGLSGAEQQGLQNIYGAASQVGTGQYGNNVLAQLAGGQMNPFAQAAPLGAGEQYGLGQVAQSAFAQNPQAQQFLQQQLSGVMNPFSQISGAEQQGLNAIQNTAFGQNGLQNASNQALQGLVGGQQNPYAQQLMDAAVRPILQNFDEQALQQRGLYTGAGQKVQGQGSSPFAHASALLAGNVANAVGDTTAQLGSSLFGQQQQAQLQALGLAQQQPGLQLQNQLAATQALGLPRQLQSDAFQQAQANQFTAAGLGDQFANTQLSRALQGTSALGLPRQIQQQGLDLQNQAFQQMQGNQLAGAQALNSNQLAQQQGQFNAQLQNLQAQALPRMVEQLGIDAGLNQYNQQQQYLLNLFGQIGSLASPNAAVLPGTQGTQGAFQKFVGGLGSGLGSKISDRRAKRDIQPAGDIGGVPMYRFRYVWESDDAPLRTGVIADEVQHIPGAVVRGADGLDRVDYMRVFSHAG